MRNFIRSQIALSELHLAEAEERIALQTQRVEALSGLEKDKAVALLKLYVEIYAQMHIHRDTEDDIFRHL
jgi:hypothetical protein